MSPPKPRKTMDERVEEWHESDSQLPLHIYLQMPWPMYGLWVEAPRLFNEYGDLNERGMELMESDLSWDEIREAGRNAE